MQNIRLCGRQRYEHHLHRHRRVAIASDNFHQLRASVWARRCGLEAESLGCASWWPLGPGYWAREAVAVVVLEVGSLL